MWFAFAAVAAAAAAAPGDWTKEREAVAVSFLWSGCESPLHSIESEDVCSQDRVLLWVACF